MTPSSPCSQFSDEGEKASANSIFAFHDDLTRGAWVNETENSECAFCVEQHTAQKFGNPFISENETQKEREKERGERNEKEITNFPGKYFRERERERNN